MKKLRKLIEYFKHGIWQKRDEEYSSKKELWLARQFRVILYTLQGIGQHGIIVRSAALTYYTLMSVVPMAALVFGIVKGFGLETRLIEYLHTRLPEYSQAIDLVSGFANNLLARTKGGIVAASGFLLLIWVLFRMFGNIEEAFNNIWEVHKSRAIARKVSDYITVIFLAPILWVSAIGAAQQVKNRIEQIHSVPLEILYWLGSLVVIWLLFTLLYFLVPNTKVKFRNAALAGVIAGTAFQIFQVAYIIIQRGVTSYNAIYGSFAALPLFLIWVQTSWQIVLLGGELSFSYQNIERYQHEKDSLLISKDNRRKVTLAVMLLIIKHFIENLGPLSAERAAEELRLPIRIVREVLFDLENAGLVLPVRSEDNDKVSLYVPSKDVNRITVYDVISGVENSGLQVDTIYDTRELRNASKLLDKARARLFEAPENMPLIELLKV